MRRSYQATFVVAILGLVLALCGTALADEAKTYFQGKRIVVNGEVRTSSVWACTTCPKSDEASACTCEPIPVREVITRTRQGVEFRYVPITPSVPRAPKASVTVIQQPAPAYTVTEQPRKPFAVQGLFRDRVVFPRRPALTVE